MLNYLMKLLLDSMLSFPFYCNVFCVVVADGTWLHFSV